MSWSWQQEKISRRKAISKVVTAAIGGVAAAAAAGGALYYYFGSTAATQPKNSLLFGASLPLSGPLKPVADEGIIPLYELWRDYVNNKGGFYISELNKSLPIELRIYDDGSDLAKVPLLYQRLILEDKVDFILPPWGTAWQLAAAPVCEKEKKILVTSIEGGDLRKLGNPYNYVFFAGEWKPFKLSGSLADFLSYHNIKSVAIATAQTDFAIDNTNYLVEELIRRKIEIRYRTEYPLDIKDASSILSAIAASEAEAILFMSYPADSLVLANALLRQGDIKPKIVYFLLGPNYPFFYNALGDKIEGMTVYMTTNRTTAGEKMAFWYNKLKEKRVDWDWADQPSIIAGLEIMEQAITKAASFDNEKVRQVLLNNQFDTIIGKIRYEIVDGKWWISTGKPRIGQWIKGELKQVWPLEDREAEAIIPYNIP